MVTGPQIHKTELRFGLALYTASLDCTPGQSAVAGHRQLLPDTFPKETEKEKTSLQDLMEEEWGRRTRQAEGREGEEFKCLFCQNVWYTVLYTVF